MNKFYCVIDKEQDKNRNHIQDSEEEKDKVTAPKMLGENLRHTINTNIA